MKFISLTQEKHAIIDAEDYLLIKSKGHWLFHNRGYAGVKRPYGWLMMHHVLLPPKEGLEIDHINGNKLDNRKINLRYVTHHENILAHFERVPSRGKFPKGVYQCGSGRYVATMMWKSKRTHLGTFNTIQEASDKYQQERQRLMKENYAS